MFVRLCQWKRRKRISEISDFCELILSNKLPERLNVALRKKKSCWFIISLETMDVIMEYGL